jgi:hypothetical protein
MMNGCHVSWWVEQGGSKLRFSHTVGLSFLNLWFSHKLVEAKISMSLFTRTGRAWRNHGSNLIMIHSCHFVAI